MLTLILLGMAISYLLVIILITIYSTRLLKNTVLRWSLRICLFVFFIFLPVSDQIIGHYYFDYLCEKEGGLHVYETVELGPEYYHEDGTPQFIDDKGRFDSSVFNDRYIFKSKSQEHYVEFVVIEKDTDYLLDTETNNLLGDHVEFIYRGGWLNNNFSYSRGGIGCNQYKTGYYDDFLKYIMKTSMNPNKSLKDGTPSVGGAP